MIKKEIGESAPKGMMTIRNYFAKCFCGQPFDNEGICNNKHFKNEEYFVPINMVRERFGQKNSSEDIHICKAMGNFCSICGAHIPEGDDICDNGHILGIKYLKNK
jgi:hypothetical protein